MNPSFSTVCNISLLHPKYIIPGYFSTKPELNFGYISYDKLGSKELHFIVPWVEKNTRLKL